MINNIFPTQRSIGVTKTLGIKNKLVSKSAYRQQYVGTTTSEGAEPKVESVTKIINTQKYKDNAGILSKKLDRLINYKEEYRHYYQLEQSFEEVFDSPEEDMDFVDHLFVVLTEMNEVIDAIHQFDKAFKTSYNLMIQQIVKKHETDLGKATILIHVDSTLGFFKGRLKKAYELHPDYFDFLIEPKTGFILELIHTFRTIKAIIPDRIDEISIKQDKNGAVIDHKL